MSGLDLQGLIKVGIDILTSVVNKKTGKILLQTGDVRNQTTDADNVESWQPFGWASRPSKPEAGKKAAQGVVLTTGGHDVCIAGQDARCYEQYGNLDFGEFCAYAPGDDGLAQGRVIGKKDGSVTVFTTDDNTKDGKSVFFRVAKDGFLFVAPWGTIRFDATGFHILHASGASFNLGGIGGLPAPLDVVASYIKMQAGSVSASSIGSPIADATSVITALAALQTQITALQLVLTTLGTKGAINGVLDVAPLATTSGVAVVAGAATVSTQSALIPKGTGMT